MGGHRGTAASDRSRTSAYAFGAAAAAVLAFAAPAGAQTAAPDPAPRLSAPPPGVVVRPAPRLRSWRCVRGCRDARTAPVGALLRVRGLRLARTYEVAFLGAAGAADDVAAAPVRRTRNAVDVRVPLGAAVGPLLVADRDGLQSAPSAVPLAVAAPVTLKMGPGAPTLQVQAQARRAFFDATRSARVAYVVHADSPARVLVELVRSRDGAVVRSWDAGQVPPEVPQSLTWNGTADGRLQPPGRYSFRVSAITASGIRAVSAHAAPAAEPDPAEFRLVTREFPIRGPHAFGTGAGRFDGGRGHQGQDTFAACGTPLVAARGGVVEFKQYHSRAGNYLVIDGRHTGVDYAYMHLHDAALVDAGDRVRTGQPIGYVGQTGAAEGCHLHFEMWSAPGWYDGGSPFDPLPALMDWDKMS
jgi:Peptidase family M23